MTESKYRYDQSKSIFFPASEKKKQQRILIEVIRMLERHFNFHEFRRVFFNNISFPLINYDLS